MAEPTRAARALAALGPAMALVLVLTAGPVAAQDGGVAIDGEACGDATGVTVVVDFQELGDDTVVVRCGGDAPADGFAALDAAGITHREALTQPGFLCRIADLPADDPCDTTSPAEAYWSYWLAPAGGEWCYANKGAGNRTPPPGTVEGWSFALDRTTRDVPPPRFDPPPAPDGVTPTPLNADDCTTPDSSGGGTEEPGTSVASGDDAGDGDAGDDAAGAPVGTGGPVDVGAGSDGGGSPVGTVVAVVAVAALIAAAVVVARRRAVTADVGPDVGP